MSQNLGRAVSILLAPTIRANELAEDLRLFYAPSECYHVCEITDQERRQTERHACHVAGVKSMRLLRKAVHDRIGNSAPIYRRYGFVPY